MMNYTVEIVHAARLDLEDIARYVTQTLKEPQISVSLSHKLIQGIMSLSVFPARCPVVRDIPYEQTSVRRLLVENYSILYVIEPDRPVVTVLRVVYSRRELKHLLDDALS